jgi:hypothetical protein
MDQAFITGAEAFALCAARVVLNEDGAMALAADGTALGQMTLTEVWRWERLARRFVFSARDEAVDSRYLPRMVRQQEALVPPWWRRLLRKVGKGKGALR